jgi:hypothetical protein
MTNSEPTLPPEITQRFNLATMSGVFPGTRTATYQRVQVQQLAGANDERTWLQLLWSTEPRRCVVQLLTTEQLTAAEPLLVLEPTAEFNEQLQAALATKGYQLRTCGSCRHWQPITQETTDALPLGRCAWQSAALTNNVALLQEQSGLALACPHWQTGEQSSATEVTPPPTMRRAAEGAAIRFPLWQRLWQRLWRRIRNKHAQRDWTTLVEERSGVGAGTEPCFACQGRIANLGALTVATAEDDKQTFSVWRCRSCRTLYLNNWIDRWERLDSLETEESYYRVAPAEAARLLAVIYGEQGGEHPQRRHERGAIRQTFLEFVAKRRPLSHQVRQGR